MLFRDYHTHKVHQNKFWATLTTALNDCYNLASMAMEVWGRTWMNPMSNKIQHFHFTWWHIPTVREDHFTFATKKGWEIADSFC